MIFSSAAFLFVLVPVLVLLLGFKTFDYENEDDEEEVIFLRAL
jgi:hypothetical protein